jgi:uncharacterized spore protein YtfJ
VDVPDLFQRIGDRLSVGRAFGPSYEHDGALIIPVAFVLGGGGGGTQPSPADAEGAGFGGVIHPLGAYVARHGQVRFVPSFDVTTVIFVVSALLRVMLARRRART